MKSLVIIPTYNEKENVEKIVEQLTCKGFYILIIDDNSPDGTGEILDKLQITNDKLQIIHREKKLGLGTAYIQGFKWALDRDFDFIFTMDADFSHNPEYLPEFVKKLAEFELIIGSRYVKSGGVRNWPVQRKLISRCGNFYAKTILQYPVNDSTSGFMGFRRKVLENINLDEVKSEGYGFLIEMKYRTHKLGYKIYEYPIIFADRTQGVSKISKHIIWEAIFLVWKLKLKIK
ncbi:MAG TPA: dolichyl-phosphate beta-D-mannosyltransferase [Elusimicrobia bacterium]|nr:dolichyl-phosphate beta-D-mannosyltransferase [Elusimicrobiota bacterium]